MTVMLAGPKVGEQWEKMGNWTQGEKRGRGAMGVECTLAVNESRAEQAAGVKGWKRYLHDGKVPAQEAELLVVVPLLEGNGFSRGLAGFRTGLPGFRMGLPGFRMGSPGGLEPARGGGRCTGTALAWPPSAAASGAPPARCRAHARWRSSPPPPPPTATAAPTRPRTTPTPAPAVRPPFARDSCQTPFVIMCSKPGGHAKKAG
eukprot:1194850-Prorocentrum_minimum.AAC.3